MAYVIVKINFLGSDDINFEGFCAKEVSSKIDWEKNIKESIQEEIEEEGYIRRSKITSSFSWS